MNYVGYVLQSDTLCSIWFFQRYTTIMRKSKNFWKFAKLSFRGRTFWFMEGQYHISPKRDRRWFIFCDLALNIRKSHGVLLSVPYWTFWLCWDQPFLIVSKKLLYHLCNQISQFRWYRPHLALNSRVLNMMDCHIQFLS